MSRKKEPSENTKTEQVTGDNSAREPDVTKPKRRVKVETADMVGDVERSAGRAAKNKLVKADAAAGVLSRTGRAAGGTGDNAGTLDFLIQAFIVQHLACFMRVRAVQESVKATFGIEVHEATVRHYDPTQRAGWSLSQELRELFKKTRQQWLEGTQDIGLFHQRVRGERLEYWYERYEEMGNGVMALRVLEQAAKEEGRVFTNRQEITGAGGAPVAIESRPPWDLSKLSEEELVTLKELGEKCGAAGD